MFRRQMRRAQWDLGWRLYVLPLKVASLELAELLEGMLRGRAQKGPAQPNNATKIPDP